MRAGVTHGPKIVVLSPAGDADVKSPVHLKLKFESFGGAKIDLSSVKVTYLKKPAVDLTERLACVTQAGGIDVAAEMPAGVHHVRVDLKDSEGRAGTANFALKVAQYAPPSGARGGMDAILRGGDQGRGVGLQVLRP